MSPPPTWLRAAAEAIFMRIPWRFPRSFGVAELAIYARVGALDFVRRHVAILNELERIRADLGHQLTVLDFGGGTSQLSVMLRLYGLASQYRVVVADVDAPAVAEAGLRPPLSESVLLDPRGSLPFETDSFDVAVSSDVFEHIPRDSRSRWANELHRVAQHCQIHHVPCDGNGFSSTRADRAYQEWHLRRFGREERWTAEHIANGVPDIGELQALFPNATLRGIANSDFWLRTITSEGERPRPMARLRRGIAYALYLRRRDSHQPYKACLLVERSGLD